MNSFKRIIRFLFHPALAACLALTIGCAAQGIRPESATDTPEHHTSLGRVLLEKGQYQEALNEFERAKALDPKYAPAYAGLGLVLAETDRLAEGFEDLNKARKLATTPAEKVEAYTGLIRLYTRDRSKGWLKKAEANFSRAIQADKEDPAPYYYLALAYKEAGDYKKAAKNFKQVLLLNKGYIKEADAGWKAIQKIEEAAPSTKFGQTIATLDKITRADVAALFVRELNLKKLFRPQNPPYPVKPAGVKQSPLDYQNHVFQAEIATITGLGIRGLEPTGHRFEPDKVISRSDFAIMIEDILAKITGEDDLFRRSIGGRSPFKDVDPGNHAFNAIMTCTTRGIMKGDLNGYFKGDQPVSGADALLILKRLKQALQR